MNMHWGDPPKNHAWTEAELDLLKRRLAEGATYGEIVLELGNGISRNAAIGKARRMKFVQAGTPQRSQPARKAKPAAAPRPAAKVERKALAPLKLAPWRPGSRVDVVEEAGVDCTRLLGLNNHTCRWPVGDATGEHQLFCGARPVAGSSYCAKHKARNHGTRLDA